MAAPRPRWPFPPTDGEPGSRPRRPDLEDVVIAIVGDVDEARRRLRDAGFADEQLRGYASEEVLAHDEAFRSERGLLDRTVGAVVDDRASMAEYVEYARQGCAALWVQVDDRRGANRVIRLLRDDLHHVWFYGPEGVEVLKVD